MSEILTKEQIEAERARAETLVSDNKGMAPALSKYAELVDNGRRIIKLCDTLDTVMKERDDLKAQLAESEAQAAAMREAMSAMKVFLTSDEVVTQAAIAAVHGFTLQDAARGAGVAAWKRFDAALEGTAGRDLIAKVRAEASEEAEKIARQYATDYVSLSPGDYEKCTHAMGAVCAAEAIREHAKKGTQ